MYVYNINIIINMHLLQLFASVISIASIASSTELLVSSNFPLPNSIQLAEYNGKYISTIDSTIVESIIETSHRTTIVVHDVSNNSNISLCEEKWQQVNSQLWNLDILDNVVNNNYSFSFTGENVTAYVIDSGISKSPEFENRLMSGISFNPDGIITNDCSGHGTHVASLLGSKTYGVAKRVKLVPVKVFNCDTTTSASNIIKAIYWVIKQPKGIVNLSLSGNKNSIVNKAIIDLKNAGFIVIVAAGNNGLDACNFSPSSESSAIVAGCFNSLNQICSYSNEGNCVTLFAPGHSILGLKNTGGTIYKSGSSMSTPHIAGVAATIYQQFPGISQDQMKNKLINMAAKNLRNFKSQYSPNLALRGLNAEKLTGTLSPTANFCKKLSYQVCIKTPECRFIKGYGCRIYNFCGFTSKKECIIRKRCKFTKRGCKLA